jgi:hypothetical protein
MRKDHRKIREEVVLRQSRPVNLRVVAAMAYHQLGKKREAIPARDYFLALNDIAWDLCQVGDLYRLNEARRLVRVEAEDLAGGRFENGGDVFISAAGELYRSLSMRRVDAMDAIEALVKARAALAAASREDAVKTGA